MHVNEQWVEHSPLLYAMTVISGRWKSSIIWHIATAPNNTLRYNSLYRDLRYFYQISHKVLSEQLAELVEDGIITRNEYDEKPPRVEYTLTKKGASLSLLLFALRDWGVLNSPFEKDEEAPYVKGVYSDDSLCYYRSTLEPTLKTSDTGRIDPDAFDPDEEHLVWVHPAHKPDQDFSQQA